MLAARDRSRHRPHAARRIGTALVLPALLLALAACSSPRPPAGTGAQPAATADRASASARPPARGGGYYLDDGPGENPPADLESIPDAVPRAEPLNPRTARPYVVFDRRYEPMTELAPYRARGIATWYGRRYHGRRTSNGEIYDMYAMTAAHPTLPIPSYVRVTHLGNGRSVVVRINDRGPFLGNRLIDLSYTAAARLGYLTAGSAEVEVELITRFDGADETMTASAQPAGDSSVPAGPALATPAAATSARIATVSVAQDGSVQAASAQAPSAQVTPVPLGAPGPAPLAPRTRQQASAPPEGLSAPPIRLDVETVIVPASQSGPTAPAPVPRAGPTPLAASPPAAAHAPAAAPVATAPTALPIATAPVPASAPPPARIVAPAPRFYLQLGAFSSRAAAESARERLARDLDGLVDAIEVHEDGGHFKVQAGPYAARGQAIAAVQRIERAAAIRAFAVAR